MPPHCDSLDGPVVRAARQALDLQEVELVLPYVPETAEAELRDAFDLVVVARAEGPEAQEVADRYFFESAVRLHRAGEGAAFTGLKPAGLDVGPVIPVAERAIASGDPSELAALLSAAVDAEVGARLSEVLALAVHRGEGVADARQYVSAMLGLQVWAHRLHTAVRAGGHPVASPK